jgi:hypothetical protein
MEKRNEVRKYLASPRAKVTPEQAGVPLHGQRRVPGLRRGEVAMLAGVSSEHTIGARQRIRVTGQGFPT